MRDWCAASVNRTIDPRNFGLIANISYRFRRPKFKTYLYVGLSVCQTLAWHLLSVTENNKISRKIGLLYKGEAISQFLNQLNNLESLTLSLLRTLSNIKKVLALGFVNLVKPGVYEIKSPLELGGRYRRSSLGFV